MALIETYGGGPKMSGKGWDAFDNIIEILDEIPKYDRLTLLSVLESRMCKNCGEILSQDQYVTKYCLFCKERFKFENQEEKMTIYLISQ